MVRLQAQILTGATIAALAFLAVSSYYILVLDEPLAAPPLWLVGGQLVAGLAVHLLCEAVGYRVPALPPGVSERDATSGALAAYRSRTMLRIAACEAIAIVSFAVAIVIGGGGAWPAYLTGATVSALLLLVHAWPWSRPIDRTERALERDGGRARLREAFGLEPRLTGPIQEL